MSKTGLKLAAVFAIVLVAASPASAFYWTLKSTPTLVNPIPPLPGADPLPIPPDTPVPGGGDPKSTPEPATALAGAIGLVVLGARRVLRRK